MSTSVQEYGRGLRHGREDDGATSTLWYEIDIDGPKEAVWRAVTSPRFVREFYYGLVLDTDWRVGEPIRYLEPDGRACILGVLEDVVEGESFTARIRYVADESAYRDPPSLVSWRLRSLGSQRTRVRIEHAGLAAAGQTLRIVQGGWPLAVVGLAALVEDGSAEEEQRHWPEHRRVSLEQARATMEGAGADDGGGVRGRLP